MKRGNHRCWITNFCLFSNFQRKSNECQKHSMNDWKRKKKNIGVKKKNSECKREKKEWDRKKTESCTNAYSIQQIGIVYTVAYISLVFGLDSVQFHLFIYFVRIRIWLKLVLSVSISDTLYVRFDFRVFLLCLLLQNCVIELNFGIDRMFWP